MANREFNIPDGLLSYEFSDQAWIPHAEDSFGGNADEKRLVMLDESKDPLASESSLPLSLSEGLYIIKEQLCTKNTDSSDSEFRVWDSSESDLAAAILPGGITNIWITPGSRVLYLGCQSITTLSHISDIVGSCGMIYVDVSPFSNMVNQQNIEPIFMRGPNLYHPCMSPVDVILCEVPMPFEENILALNAKMYLKDGGHFIVSLKSNLKRHLFEDLIPQHLMDRIDRARLPERDLGIGVQFQSLIKESFTPSQCACINRNHYYVVGEYLVPLDVD